MASGVTTTGEAEMRANVERLPDAVTQALRNVARATAEREQATARRLLAEKQLTFTRELAGAIVIREDLARKQYVVESGPPPGQAANVPIWNEYGTRFMRARPYMRPASDMETERYRADMDKASVSTVAEILK